MPTEPAKILICNGNLHATIAYSGMVESPFRRFKINTKYVVPDYES